MYGVHPLVVRMGGTLPISELFTRYLGLSTVFFSFSTADEDYHAPNEFFRIHRLHEGLEAWARYWELLGALDPARHCEASGKGRAADDRPRSGMTSTDSASDLARAEAKVEAHSASLKKELGVRDLALTQILFIVGLTWIGVAGKLGPSHVILWLLALVLFYIPSAVVVMYLNRLMPLEGGLYQWAKLGFNETVGFMLAWNLWLYVIMYTSEVGLQCATYLSYAIGPSAAWMTTSSWFVALSSAVVLTLMMVASTIGLSVGKWVHNAGGVMMLVIFATIILLPILGLVTGTLPEYHPFRTERPAFTLFNLNLLGKMGFGALGGFEYIAILAGETRVPSRAVGRSVLIAAPDHRHHVRPRDGDGRGLHPDC